MNKKILALVMSVVMAVAFSVSAFAAGSKSAGGSTPAEVPAGGYYIAVGSTSDFKADEQKAASDMGVWMRSCGYSVYTFNVNGTMAGDVSLNVPTPAGCAVVAYHWHGGQWLELPVVSFGGGIVTVHMDGNFCPVIVGVKGGAAAGAAAGTSPKTGAV